MKSRRHKSFFAVNPVSQDSTSGFLESMSHLQTDFHAKKYNTVCKTDFCRTFRRSLFLHENHQLDVSQQPPSRVPWRLISATHHKRMKCLTFARNKPTAIKLLCDRENHCEKLQDTGSRRTQEINKEASACQIPRRLLGRNSLFFSSKRVHLFYPDYTRTQNTMKPVNVMCNTQECDTR